MLTDADPPIPDLPPSFSATVSTASRLVVVLPKDRIVGRWVHGRALLTTKRRTAYRITANANTPASTAWDAIRNALLLRVTP